MDIDDSLWVFVKEVVKLSDKYEFSISDCKQFLTAVEEGNLSSVVNNPVCKIFLAALEKCTVTDDNNQIVLAHIVFHQLSQYSWYGMFNHNAEDSDVLGI